MDPTLRLWESLRSDVRQLDQVVDAQLAKLEDAANVNEGNTTVGHSGAGAGAGSGPDSARRSMQEAIRVFGEQKAAIEENLRRYEQQLQAMAGASGGSLTAVKHTERFQALLQEKRRAVTRIAGEFTRRREQLELLPSIAVDLKAYDDQAGARLLMEEQDAIRHTHNRVTHILEQAHGTRDRLESQRERFAHMGDGLVQIAERIPVIQNVLKRIDARRRREVVVLGTVVSACLCLVFLFW